MINQWTDAQKTDVNLLIDKFIDHSSWMINLFSCFGVQYRCMFLLVTCILTRPTCSSKYGTSRKNINLLVTECEGRTGEYWPLGRGTKTTEGQYSPVRLELARLVSSLSYGTRAMLVLNLRVFENKKYTAYDRFHGKGPYGEIPTKKEPIRTLGFAVPYNK